MSLWGIHTDSRFGRAAQLLAIFVTLSAHGCRSSPKSDFDFEKTAASVRVLTVPPSGRITNTAASTRGQFHIETAWDVEAPINWQDYTQGVRERVPDDYKQVKANADVLRFLKRLDGDSLTIEIKCVSPAPPVRVHATFRAAAD